MFSFLGLETVMQKTGCTLADLHEYTIITNHHKNLLSYAEHQFHHGNDT